MDSKQRRVKAGEVAHDPRTRSSERLPSWIPAAFNWRNLLNSTFWKTSEESVIPSHPVHTADHYQESICTALPV